MPRPRLLARLSEALATRLTLVIAAAGYGKTTLLCEWRKHLAERSSALVAWVSLDRHDDDPRQFLTSVCDALHHASDGRIAAARTLLATDARTALATVLSVLTAELSASTERIVLMLDDYAFDATADVHETMRALVLGAPENLHLCIAGRASLPLELSAWRAAREVIELDHEALRFREDETATFLARIPQDPLVCHDAHALAIATEGWIAGLRIAVAPSRTRLAEGAVRHETWAYLQHQVLDALPPRLVTFLEETSILTRLAPELCAAVTGATEVDTVLADLAARHLFIAPIEGASGAFRYHEFFRTCLHTRLLARDAARATVLHRRAAAWFAAQGAWAEAVEHALFAGDVEQADGWIEHCAMRFIESGDLRTLERWTRKLSPESLRGRARVRLARAWSLALLFRFDEAASAIAELSADAASGAIALAVDERLELRVISAMSAALADNDVELAATLAASCLSEMPAGDTWMHRIVRNVSTWASLRSHAFAASRAVQLELPEDGAWDSKLFAPTCRNGLLGMGWVQQGRLSRASELYADVAAFARRAGPHSAPNTYLACVEAEIAYESGDLDGARDLLAGRWEMIDEVCGLDAVLRAYTYAARIDLHALGAHAALERLARGRAIGIRRSWHRLVCALDVEHVRVMLSDGRLREAKRAAARLDRLVAALPAERAALCEACRWYRGEAWARIELAGGDGELAIARLEPLLAALRGARLTLASARISALLARAYVYARREGDARRVLIAALVLRGDETIVRSFADEGPAIESALARALAELGSTLGATAATERRRTSKVAHGAPARPLAALSSREQEILGYLAEGTQNKEIAVRLSLSPETVKWHLKNIYEKLSVGSRTEAASVAVRLGLA